jgi:titin
MAPPSPPQNFQIVEVTKNTALLQWEAPAIDGCSPVLNYIVDKKMSTAKAFSIVSDEVDREQYRVMGLNEGEAYLFRVRAVNKFGASEGAESTEAARTSELASAPQQLTVDDITKTSISLSWNKPESDGGAPVVGYQVESQMVGMDTWRNLGKATLCKYKAVDLSEDQEYLFKIRARNAVGLGEAVFTRQPIKAQEIIISPDVDLRSLYRASFTAKAGDNVKLLLPLIGKPKPKVQWYKGEDSFEELQETKHCNTAIDDENNLVFSIKDAKRTDADTYRIRVKNLVEKKFARFEPLFLINQVHQLAHLSTKTSKQTNLC